METIRKPFDQRSEKYRKRYWNALNELYRTTEMANSEDDGVVVERCYLTGVRGGIKK